MHHASTQRPPGKVAEIPKVWVTGPGGSSSHNSSLAATVRMMVIVNASVLVPRMTLIH